MKVSIITVCYNSEKTIERTIESVFNQTYQDIEYIIVDGASQDNTLNIINKYKEKFGQRLIVISEPDHGIYDAMNKGIEAATGDIIGIINSDDWYEPDAVQNIVDNYQKGKEYQILYGVANIVDGSEIKETIWRSISCINQHMILHPATFVTKSVYEKYGVFSLDYKICSDYDLFLKYSKISEIEFVPIRNVVSNFSTGGASSNFLCQIESNEIRYKHNAISKKVYKKLKNRFRLIQFKHELVRRVNKWRR